VLTLINAGGVWRYNVSLTSEETRSQSVASGRVIEDDHLSAVRRAAELAGGQPLRSSNFNRREWKPALTLTGLTGTHFHDLRHAGNQLTSDAGASLREMMTRMGHDSARAALIYQHSTDERQREIARQVGRKAREALGKSGTSQSGTRMARKQRDES
jgi:hypothetical protein